MKEYIVIWSAYDGVITSKVMSDTEDLSRTEWVKFAAVSENWGERDVTQLISDNGFHLYAVIRGPVHFVF